MRYSRLKGFTSRIPVAVALVALLVTVGSCGGPYKGREVEVPEQKIDIADELFEKGKYSRAAVEYKDFLALYAGDERSDYVQYRAAECYRLDEEYALAAVEYRILINDYGYSEYVDDAFLLEGVCAFAQSPRAERDQTKSYEALERLTRFMELFPASPRMPEAKELQGRLYQRLGKKDFMNARLYYRKKEYTAARIYFGKLIDLYPSSIWAARSHYYRGMIYEREGRIEDALAEYEAAVASPSPFSEEEDADKRIAALQGEQTSER